MVLLERERGSSRIVLGVWNINLWNMGKICTCLKSNGKDLVQRKRWMDRGGYSMGVIYQMQVAWLAFSFETGGKWQLTVSRYGRLWHSVWLITSAFYVNYRAWSSFKTGKKGEDQRFEEDGEVWKMFAESGSWTEKHERHSGNYGGTGAAIVNLLRHSLSHHMTFFNSTQLTWRRLGESKYLVPSHWGFTYMGRMKRQIGNGI